jgi:DNA repair protein RecO (recombination protein O)
MSLVETPAVVLQAFRYSETSKVVRLATRELGVQSAIAKGVLRPRSRFGAALEFLSEGAAQVYYHERRELQTLAAFDVADLRRGLAADVGRFAAAAAQAELMLRIAPAAPLPAAYDVFTAGLDAVLAAAPADVDGAATRGVWRLLAVLGFEASLETCVRDGAPVTPDGTVAFSVSEGGALCARCAAAPAPGATHPPTTRLPAQAYRDLRALCRAGASLPPLDASHAAAHRRLVARFVRHHVGEARPLTALDFWERRAWPVAS